MYKAIVFAGTTEGYEISRFLSENKVSVLACVATEYGSRSLEENEFLSIRAERLDKEQMQELFAAERPELVLDATHPYAAEVTVNIREACENTAVSYVRVLREGGVHKDAVYVENTEAAVDYLKHVSGNVLLTTGSKELSAYTEIPGYQERMFARVLSIQNVIENCRMLGFEGKNLIAMQGPFSKELNHWPSGAGKGNFCKRMQTYAAREIWIPADTTYGSPGNWNGKQGNIDDSGQ